ncbi:ABC-F family ATP-binding cassette domain-containing protein [Paracoccus fistulariae]|uniref:ABC-F family ATP-binding cassette domain-containing protein n=1 Tax=Paracoccus fistulariae TaxID=658446 RepID=A0ABY7SJC3_9RHOB|nr:ABC-F family ATP-binding cassette domain-containing protein [Paracoccus fistulariae]MDB6180674.1 ABC-F family ATP-binding cassette domain-containing protein [Paracoccus fistulariae]WCR07094.1 ABC-F family ATP-binding cassette domain-containing protein [Paracoccus fistulariae]
MARAPLLQLTDISLTFGGNPVFQDLSLIVQQGDRVALVGRNGSGKSTLMKVMAGLVEPDRGEVILGAGAHVGYMEQDPDLSGFQTLGEFAASGLPESEAYRVEMAAEGLKFDPARPVSTASGGERRRAALARLLAQAPELMLLDEPTNHLDIEAIGWLEDHLSQTRAAYVIISHDRAFLRRLTRATLWIDRGEVRRQERGFEHFEDWREAVWSAEDDARHKLDRKIKAEARWAVEGISARRKRNQGRVRALADLRAERAAQIRRQGTAAMAFEAGPQSGKRVIEAQGITKSFGDRTILKPFDLRVKRGDRIAFVGPNGAGKTTLIRMLTGEIPPDQGSVTLGTNLDLAVFDQTRSALNPDQSLWESLTGDPEMRVSGRADQVMVRGQPRHVVGYLKDFLFDDAQVRAPVRSLSGGEKARLLLARLMARNSNLLVLDEPTNDLDVETLDLLQDILGDYDGTVLLVSHDRDFIDRVADTTIAMEGDGRAVIYAGGWSDYRAQRGEDAPATAPVSEAPARKPVSAEKPKAAKSGLSFTEKHRLEELPAVISRLEAEIAKLSAFLSDPDLYATAPQKFEKATAALSERQSALEAAEEEWLLLEEKAAG